MLKTSRSAIHLDTPKKKTNTNTCICFATFRIKDKETECSFAYSTKKLIAKQIYCSADIQKKLLRTHRRAKKLNQNYIRNENEQYNFTNAKTWRGTFSRWEWFSRWMSKISNRCYMLQLIQGSAKGALFICLKRFHIIYTFLELMWCQNHEYWLRVFVAR
jgi:hypothetical protein